MIKLRRVMSVFMAIIMVFGVLNIMPVSVYAEEQTTKVIKELQVYEMPDKQYIPGTELSVNNAIDGLKVKIIYVDDSYEIVTYSDRMLTNENVSYKVSVLASSGSVFMNGNNKVMIGMYDNDNYHKLMMDLYAYDTNIKEVILSKIPDKTVYYYDVDSGELDFTGAEFIVNYKDGTSMTYIEGESPENKLHKIISDFDDWTIGKKTVDIKFCEWKFTYDIEVKEDPHITNPPVKINISKVPYNVFQKNIDIYADVDTTDEELLQNVVSRNMDGAQLAVTYKDGTVKYFNFEGAYSATSLTYACTYFWKEEGNRPIAVWDEGDFSAEVIFCGLKTVFTANHTDNEKMPDSVKLDYTSLTLGKGENFEIKKIISPSDATTNCTWVSSDKSVLSVNKFGEISSFSEGTATITITTKNGKKATCKVTVKAEPQSVTLSKTSLTLGVGEEYVVSETTNSGSYANAKNLKWSSSDENVAVVTKGSGNKATIKAVGPGTATVTIKLYNNKTATCKVTVKSAPTSVKIDSENLVLGKGESITIKETTNSGSYANADNLVWSSSNPNVASVTKDSGNKAKITAKGTGTAYIKIALYNGKTAQCRVTVKSAPASVTVNPTSIILGKGESYTISEVTNSGSYANAENLKWSSTNTSVATVTKGSGNTAKITAKGTGTAYIKITLYNGKTAQCKVTVKNAPSSVKTNPTSMTLGVGESYTISETTNSGTYANAENLKWSSSDTSVVTVTKGEGNKAKITATGVGTAYVKITLYNGKTSTCKVTVKSAPTSVSLSKTSITLSKGKTYTISEVTNSGSYANAANLKWSSTNTGVATVTKGSGNKATITAKSKGTAYIKITLYNGKTAQCKVTVK